MLDNDERQNGRFPEENGDVSKLLYQRYKNVLRMAHYPVLRLEEMVMGPDYFSEEGDSDDQRRDGGESSGRRNRSQTTERTFNSAASRSRDSSGGEDEMESARYLRDGLEEVSSPEYWDWLHTYESTSDRSSGDEPLNAEMFAKGQSSTSESWAHRESRGEPLRLDGALQRESGALLPESGEAREHGEGRRGVRVPLTYPPLTRDELDGTRYPGQGVDLQPFSDYERMARLSECLDLQMEQAVVENNYELYENLGMRRNHVEGLRLAASDIRPSEG